MSKREYKIHSPGVEPQREAPSVVVPESAHVPSELINSTPAGLPHPDEIDVTTLRRPVLTTEGWLCPDPRPGGA